MNRIAIAVVALMGALTSAAPLPDDGEGRRLRSEEMLFDLNKQGLDDEIGTRRLQAGESFLPGDFTKQGLDDEIGGRRLQDDMSVHQVTPGEVDILTRAPLPDVNGRRLENGKSDRLKLLTELFKMIDKDGSGDLEYDEVLKFAKQLDETPSIDDSLSFAAANLNREDEVLDLFEFVHIFGDTVLEMVMRARVRCLVEIFDATNDGKLDEHDSAKLLENIPAKYTTDLGFSTDEIMRRYFNQRGPRF